MAPAPRIEPVTTCAPSWYFNPDARAWPSTGLARDAGQFHRQLPGYQPTPLVPLPDLAAELGVGQVYIKDESSRLGLPAFKILGASWACAKLVAGQTGAELKLDALRAAAGGTGLRLVTATDGNHGRAVARMAALLGVSATVFVPAVMSTQAERAISTEGADVIRVDADYDEAVRIAAAYCEAGADPAAGDSRMLVQDTAWPGYEQVPRWIVDGYATLLNEIDARAGRSCRPRRRTGRCRLARAGRRRALPSRRPVPTGDPQRGARERRLPLGVAHRRATDSHRDERDQHGRSQLWHRVRGRMARPRIGLRRCDRRVGRSRSCSRCRPGRSRRLLRAERRGDVAAARGVLLGEGAAGRRAELGVGTDSTVVLISTEAAELSEPQQPT